MVRSSRSASSSSRASPSSPSSPSWPPCSSSGPGACSDGRCDDAPRMTTPPASGTGHPRFTPAARSDTVRRVWPLMVVVAALSVPAFGSRFYTFLANDVVIWALFATSLNLLVGYTGLVSFGHAAYFGIGAYATGILMKKLGLPFVLAFPAAGVLAGGFALLFGLFCVRLTRIYFAMLTLAFAQIVWAICFKWNEVTGGEQGMPEVPYPDLAWMGRLPLLRELRTSDHFYLVTVVLVALCLWILHRVVRSPFGRMLTTIRENAERAEFIGVHVRRYELAAFVLAGAFAGLAGGLFGIFNRGVFPDFAYWTKSSEVL